MPAFCVAANCTSTTGNGKVSLYPFPFKYPDTVRKWVKFVQCKRADFHAPTKYSCLCSDHFIATDFINYAQLKAGFAKRLVLKMSSVPSVHKNPVPTLLKKPDPETSASNRSADTCTGETKRMTMAAIRSRSATKRNAVKRMYTIRATYPVIKVNVCGVVEPDENLPQSAPQPCCSCCCHQRPVILTKNACIQTESSKISKGVQTEMHLSDHETQTSSSADNMKDTEEVQLFLADSDSDGDWQMESDTVFESDDDKSETSRMSNEEEMPKSNLERKFIVFENCLQELLTLCPSCLAPCCNTLQIIGSAIIVFRQCGECGETNTWQSQPKLRQIFTGNLLMSAAILFSGSLSSKIMRFLDIFGVLRISSNVYFRHQKRYLHATVHKVWQQEQQGIIQMVKNTGNKLTIAGDGRCDSPGFSAKYGGYNMLECNAKRIIDVQVVQSNEVANSNACELEGLKRSMAFLADNGLEVDTVITDRHKSVNKYLREEHPQIKHYYDTWHVAKALGKKLDALATKTGCELVGRWRKSITNHLHWCAASTLDGDGKKILAKWNSLPNHVANIHEGHSADYPKCLHGAIDVDCDVEWFDPGTAVYDKLTSVVEDKFLLKDVQKLLPIHQTSSLEAFHSLIFAPKNTAFSYLGMRSRLCLAALHYNENADREQAADTDGNKKYSIIFPKAKKGEHSIKKRQQQTTHGYADHLVEYVMDQYARSPTDLAKSLYDIVPYIPDHLSASNHHPDKEEAVRQFTTRFAQS